MTSSTAPDEDSHDFGASKQLYDRVLECVRLQTGGPDAPDRAGVRRFRVPLLVAGSDMVDAEAVERKLAAAIDRGDVLAYEDRDGHTRLARTTRAGMQAVVAEQNARDDPDRALIERCVAALEASDE